MDSTELKVVFIGEQGAGKTSIINQFVRNDFNEHSTSTIGAMYVTKTISV